MVYLRGDDASDGRHDDRDTGRLMRALVVPLIAGLFATACTAGESRPVTLSPTRNATDRFWAIIEHAREGGSGCGGVARRVTDTLAKLPPGAIEEFGHELSQRMAETYRWDLWAVAYVANGGESDDGFEDFRGWMLTRGRAQYEEALRDPPAAVRGASRFVTFMPLECEEMLNVAHDAYERLVHAPLPPSTYVVRPKEPLGKPWREETIDSAYPGLSARVKQR
jgi:hypothetical protein